MTVRVCVCVVFHGCALYIVLLNSIYNITTDTETYTSHPFSEVARPRSDEQKPYWPSVLKGVGRTTDVFLRGGDWGRVRVS